MSNPRYGWWSYIKDMLRRYPALREQHEQSLQGKVTPNYGASMPTGSGVPRSTEQLVMHAMSRNAAREYDAVTRAVEQLDPLKFRMIKLIYWDRSHTLSGAAMQVHISYRTARRWHSEVIYQIARNFGLLD